MYTHTVHTNTHMKTLMSFRPSVFQNDESTVNSVIFFTIQSIPINFSALQSIIIIVVLMGGWDVFWLMLVKIELNGWL